MLQSPQQLQTGRNLLFIENSERSGVWPDNERSHLLSMRKDDREFYKSIGICPVCGKNQLYGTEKMCPECRADAANLMSTKRENDREEYNTYHRSYSKLLYQKRKEQGLCVRCGKCKAIYSELRCCKCKEKMQNTRNHQSKREQRSSEDKCYFCGADCIPGMKVCKTHYSISMANLQKSNGSELFRQLNNLHCIKSNSN